MVSAWPGGLAATRGEGRIPPPPPGGGGAHLPAELVPVLADPLVDLGDAGVPDLQQLQPLRLLIVQLPQRPCGRAPPLSCTITPTAASPAR